MNIRSSAALAAMASLMCPAAGAATATPYPTKPIKFAMMRLSVSLELPACCGTIRRMGLVGYGVGACACAGLGAARTPAKPLSRKQNRRYAVTFNLNFVMYVPTFTLSKITSPGFPFAMPPTCHATKSRPLYTLQVASYAGIIVHKRRRTR